MATILINAAFRGAALVSIWAPKIKHNGEMFGKICPNMKLTPPCIEAVARRRFVKKVLLKF